MKIQCSKFFKIFKRQITFDSHACVKNTSEEIKCKICGEIVEDLICECQRWSIENEFFEREYSSSEEFFEKSGWFFDGVKRSADTFDLFVLKIFVGQGHKKIAKTFSGVSLSDCEQKLLEWANDELI